MLSNIISDILQYIRTLYNNINQSVIHVNGVLHDSYVRFCLNRAEQYMQLLQYNKVSNYVNDCDYHIERALVYYNTDLVKFTKGLASTRATKT